MARGPATDWKVVVGTTDLSSWAHDVQIEDTRDQLDASGFSPTGARTYVPGLRDQTVTVQFRQDRAAGGPYATIKPLYESGSSFAFFVQPDSDAGTSATNELFGGSANCYSFPASATLNEVEELEVAFRPASNSVFSYGTVAP